MDEDFRRLSEDARRAAIALGYAALPVQAIELVLLGGLRVALPVIPDVPVQRPTADPRPPARHSDDFRSVHWYGADYQFSPTQAAAIRSLWEAWENDTPDVGNDTLMTATESERGTRLRDLFRNHPAWGELIVGTGTSGNRTFRLQVPE